MVTTRTPSNFGVLQQAKTTEYFTKFGRADITWNSFVEVLNAAGRLSSRNPTPTTISGQLQFVTLRDKEYLQSGLAQIGDGIFYTLPGYSISPNDEIVVDSVTWKLTRQVEGEQTNSDTVYQAWIAVRKPEA